MPRMYQRDRLADLRRRIEALSVTVAALQRQPERRRIPSPIFRFGGNDVKHESPSVYDNYSEEVVATSDLPPLFVSSEEDEDLTTRISFQDTSSLESSQIHFDFTPMFDDYEDHGVESGLNPVFDEYPDNEDKNCLPLFSDAYAEEAAMSNFLPVFDVYDDEEEDFIVGLHVLDELVEIEEQCCESTRKKVQNLYDKKTTKDTSEKLYISTNDLWEVQVFTVQKSAITFVEERLVPLDAHKVFAEMSRQDVKTSCSLHYAFDPGISYEGGFGKTTSKVTGMDTQNTLAFVLTFLDILWCNVSMLGRDCAKHNSLHLTSAHVCEQGMSVHVYEPSNIGYFVAAMEFISHAFIVHTGNFGSLPNTTVLSTLPGLPTTYGNRGPFYITTSSNVLYRVISMTLADLLTIFSCDGGSISNFGYNVTNAENLKPPGVIAKVSDRSPSASFIFTHSMVYVLDSENLACLFAWNIFVDLVFTMTGNLLICPCDWLIAWSTKKMMLTKVYCDGTHLGGNDYTIATILVYEYCELTGKSTDSLILMKVFYNLDKLVTCSQSCNLLYGMCEVSKAKGIDEDLHSWYLGVYRRETMRRVFDSNTFVFGMQGLGAEIPKILTVGVNSVSFHDERCVELWDLSVKGYAESSIDFNSPPPIDVYNDADEVLVFGLPVFAQLVEIDEQREIQVVYDVLQSLGCTAQQFSACTTILAFDSHVFPLKCKDGGVLKRAGHIEVSVLASLSPAAVVCEVYDDGLMVRFTFCCLCARFPRGYRFKIRGRISSKTGSMMQCSNSP